MANDFSARTDELKLRKGNSYPIEIHPEPNCDFSPLLCVRVLAIEIL